MHRLHDGFEVMKPILASAENIEQQIDLAVRFKDEARPALFFILFLGSLFLVPEPRNRVLNS